MLAELQSVLASAIQGMSIEDLGRHPVGKWSSAEILDHLNLTYLGTIKNFERCLASGRSQPSPDRSSHRWRRIAILNLGFFPSGRTTPQWVRPRGTPAAQLTKEIFENIRRMDHLIHESGVRWGHGEPVASHPILGALTAQEWRKFHLVHGKHHVRQILRLKKT